MAEASPKKAILGYVSAYLKRTPRTYAEAERDQRAQSAWLCSNPGAAHTANEND